MGGRQCSERAVQPPGPPPRSAPAIPGKPESHRPGSALLPAPHAHACALRLRTQARPPTWRAWRGLDASAWARARRKRAGAPSRQPPAPEAPQLPPATTGNYWSTKSPPLRLRQSPLAARGDVAGRAGTPPPSGVKRPRRLRGPGAGLRKCAAAPCPSGTPQGAATTHPSEIRDILGTLDSVGSSAVRTTR